MTDLKPCPFCGAEANLQVFYRGLSYNWGVVCSETYAHHITFSGTQDEVIREWNTRETDKLKDLLIDIDSWHELLGVELLEAFKEGSFDPDANFTPLEHRLNLLYKALGFNKKEIREEAYKLSKKRLGEEE